MSRQKLIMGNWKMNGTKASVQSLIQSIKTIKPLKNTKIIVFPPYVYLNQLETSALAYGAQNLSQHDNGAFTGEISGEMLKDAGCEYVLVGHSERRQLFGETNDIVAQKFLKAVKAGLKPVLCVGETQEERLANKTQQIVLAQLESVLNLKSVGEFSVAYEPVWAIGTGLTATPEQAQAVHKLLREHLPNKNIPIVYGGSVKASNAKQLFEMPDIDGALIGGASLNGEEFKTICELMGS